MDVFRDVYGPVGIKEDTYGCVPIRSKRHRLP